MFSIRVATPNDATGIARVHVESYRAVYLDLLPDDVLDGFSEIELEKGWRDQLQRGEPPGCKVLVVVDEEARIIGYSRFGPARDLDSILEGDTGEIYGFYLHPHFWGQGVGRTLMEATLEDLTERGFLAATLNVVEGNDRARFFYERQGWIVDREAAPWYGAPQLRYRKEL